MGSMYNHTLDNSSVSVIVCCYNSAARIAETIRHLCLQKLAGSIRCEIIVVDNASTDNTVEIATAEWLKYKPSAMDFNVVQEDKPGLSFARQKGADQAKFEYIIFCDDDNWLCDSYIESACRLLDANASIGALGGQGIAVCESKIPDWFDQYKYGYAVGRQANESGDITTKGFLWGAGLVTRKSLFLASINDHFPSLLSDRKGSALTSGGDYEYCQRLVLMQYKLYYDENLVFRHYIPSGRLTDEYRVKLFKSFEDSSGCLKKYIQAVEFKQMTLYKKMVTLFSTGKHIVKNTIKGQEISSHAADIIFWAFKYNIRKDADLRLIRHFYDMR